MSQEKYLESFELKDLFERTPRIIKSRGLYDDDPEIIFTRIRSRLAEHPAFSSNSPNDGASILIGHISQMLANWGYELNHFPYQLWIELLRWQNAQISPAEYPVINLRFSRDRNALREKAPGTVPLGTEVSSNRDRNLKAITIIQGEIPAGSEVEFLDVPARLNSTNTPVDSLVFGEFAESPALPGIGGVLNDGTVISEGRSRETLTEACLRTRQENLRGQRCVTPRDFLSLAYSLGATKAKVIPRIQKDVPGTFGNLVSIFIYPTELIPLIQLELNRQKLASQWAVAVAPEINEVSGSLTVRVASDVSFDVARQNALQAIIDNINPPYGLWGNQAFDRSLSTTLLKVAGIYAVEDLDLSVDSKPWNGYKKQVKPWDLFKVSLENLILDLRR